MFTIFEESKSKIRSDIISQRKQIIAEPQRWVQSGLQIVSASSRYKRGAHCWLLSIMLVMTVLNFYNDGSALSRTVLISSCYCSKSSQTWKLGHLKNTIYYLVVLEVRNPITNCRWGCIPSRGSRKMFL